MINIYITKKEKNFIIINTVFFLLCFILYIFYHSNNNLLSQPQNFLWMFWMGVFLLFYIIISWRKISNKWLTPYSIFFLFLILFSYGQSLMWAFGIHKEGEIGDGPLFVNYNNYDISQVITTLIVSYILILGIHTGTIFSKIRIKKRKRIFILDDNNLKKPFFRLCLFLFLISYPIVMWVAFRSFIQSSTYGYESLYYGDAYYSRNAFVVTMIAVFPNTLFGMMITGNGSKKIFGLVWGAFLVYAFCYSLSGNRGGWVIILVVLAWISVKEKYIKVKKSTIVKAIILATILMYILYFIRIYRDSRDIVFVLKQLAKIENQPFVQIIFEMGSTMSILLLVIKEGLRWNYGNTWFMAIPNAISSGLVQKITSDSLVLPNEWLASEVIHINWGTGFSLVGEIYLNYGQYTSVIVSIILGIVVGKLLDFEKDDEEGILKTYISAGVLYMLISWCRNTLQMVMFEWIRGSVLILILLLFYKKISIRRKNNG